MKRIRALDYLLYVIVRALVCFVQALSLEACEAMANYLATLCHGILRIRRSVIDENLRHSFPELSDAERRGLAWRMWRHLFLMVAEVAQAPRKIHDTNWRDYISLSRADVIIRAAFSDRPLVIVAGHYGNFELSGYMLGLFGFQTYTIARPLDNPFLDRFLNEFRGAKGQHILPKIGSASQIDMLLRNGATLAFLGDQHAGRGGCWVEFFGRAASTHKGIALFALTSDAPLVFCYTRRRGHILRSVLATDGEADPRTIPAALRSVPALTQWYTSLLERTIRLAPDQYWWLHRRWRDAPAKASGRGQAA